VVTDLSWIEWILTGDKLLGVVVGLVALLGALGRWFWRRVSTQVSEGVSRLSDGHTDIKRRLEAVEGEVKSLTVDVGALQGRMGTMEHRFDTLATSRELHDLALLVTKIGANSEAQSNMVRILYAAADRAGQLGGS